MMQNESGVRWRWLKLLYWYTFLGAGIVGLLIVIAPGFLESLFGLPLQDPYMIGVVGSVWLAFGLIAAVGLRAPLRFAPIFLVQLAYKSVWLVVVFLPRLFRGAVPMYSWIIALVFVSYVVLDIIAIPFSKVLAIDTGQRG